MHFQWEPVIPSAPFFCKKLKKQQNKTSSSFHSCSNTLGADTAHLLRLGHTSLIITGKEGPEREQGEEGHPPVEGLGRDFVDLDV